MPQLSSTRKTIRRTTHPLRDPHKISLLFSWSISRRDFFASKNAKKKHKREREGKNKRKKKWMDGWGFPEFAFTVNFLCVLGGKRERRERRGKNGGENGEKQNSFFSPTKKREARKEPKKKKNVDIGDAWKKQKKSSEFLGKWVMLFFFSRVVQ